MKNQRMRSETWSPSRFVLRGSTSKGQIQCVGRQTHSRSSRGVWLQFIANLCPRVLIEQSRPSVCFPWRGSFGFSAHPTRATTARRLRGESCRSIPRGASWNVEFQAQVEPGHAHCSLRQPPQVIELFGSRKSACKRTRPKIRAGGASTPGVRGGQHKACSCNSTEPNPLLPFYVGRVSDFCRAHRCLTLPVVGIAAADFDMSMFAVLYSVRGRESSWFVTPFLAIFLWMS